MERIDSTVASGIYGGSSFWAKLLALLLKYSEEFIQALIDGWNGKKEATL